MSKNRRLILYLEQCFWWYLLHQAQHLDPYTDPLDNLVTSLNVFFSQQFLNSRSDWNLALPAGAEWQRLVSVSCQKRLVVYSCIQPSDLPPNKNKRKYLFRSNQVSFKPKTRGFFLGLWFDSLTNCGACNLNLYVPIQLSFCNTNHIVISS
jgi:hypothetical protein